MYAISDRVGFFVCVKHEDRIYFFYLEVIFRAYLASHFSLDRMAGIDDLMRHFIDASITHHFTGKLA